MINMRLRKRARGIHGGAAIGGQGLEPESVVVVYTASYGEGAVGEQGVFCTKLESGNWPVVGVFAIQVHEHGGDQWAVHNQVGIALYIGGVRTIVMDAVTVKGQRRIAKQGYRVSEDLILPGARWDRDGFRSRGRGIRWTGGGPKDDVLDFFQRDLVVHGKHITDFHEDQLPRSTKFRRNVQNFRFPTDSGTDDKGGMEAI